MLVRNFKILIVPCCLERSSIYIESPVGLFRSPPQATGDRTDYSADGNIFIYYSRSQALSFVFVGEKLTLN